MTKQRRRVSGGSNWLGIKTLYSTWGETPLGTFTPNGGNGSGGIGSIQNDRIFQQPYSGHIASFDISQEIDTDAYDQQITDLLKTYINLDAVDVTHEPYESGEADVMSNAPIALKTVTVYGISGKSEDGYRELHFYPAYVKEGSYTATSGKTGKAKMKLQGVQITNLITADMTFFACSGLVTGLASTVITIGKDTPMGQSGIWVTSL